MFNIIGYWSRLDQLLAARFDRIQTLEEQGPSGLIEMRDDCWEVEAERDWDGDIIFVPGPDGVWL